MHPTARASIEQELRSKILESGSDASCYGFGPGPFRIAQHYDELVPYCMFILEHGPITSYLEVGIAHGGMLHLMTDVLSPETVRWIDLREVHRIGLARNIGAVQDAVPDAAGFYGDSHSPEASEFLADDVFDLALIDGDHSEVGVRQDALMVMPHIAPGGLLAFHDTHAPGETSAFMRKMDFAEHGFRVVGQWHAGGTSPGTTVLEKVLC